MYYTMTEVKEQMTFTEYIAEVQKQTMKAIELEAIKLAKEKYNLELKENADFSVKMDYFDKLELVKQKMTNKGDLMMSTLKKCIEENKDKFIKYSNETGLVSIQVDNDINVSIPRFCSKKVQNYAIELSDIKANKDITLLGIKMLQSKSIENDKLIKFIQVNNKPIKIDIQSIIVNNENEFYDLMTSKDPLFLDNFENIVSAIAFYYGILHAVLQKKTF